MFRSRLFAAGLTGLTTLALAQSASAQGTDLTTLSAEDVLKLQVASGQTQEQLEEQLSGQLDFDAKDAFEERRMVKDYAESLISQASGAAGGSFSAALPIRELTYDFDLKTYKVCVPSSLLYQSPVAGGTAEALVSFDFGDLAQKNPDICPFFKSGYQPGVTLGTGNYMEIELEMAGAEKLHNSIEAEQSLASFTCDSLTFVQGRFDTGPTQLSCGAPKIDISVEGGQTLSFSAGSGDDSWITRSGSDDDTMAKTDDGAGDDMADSATGAEDSTPDEIEPGTLLTETALELDKSDRIEVQRRLTLLGYSTRGVDGVFGAGTRAGISQWQIKNGLPVSGYLSGDQLDLLNVTSEELYQNWLVNNANNTSTSTRKRRYYRGSDGCLRTRPGNARRTIVPGQSRYCNRRRRGLN